MMMAKISLAVIAYSCEVSAENVSCKDGSLLRCCIHNFRGRSVVYSMFNRLSYVINGRKQLR